MNACKADLQQLLQQVEDEQLKENLLYQLEKGISANFTEVLTILIDQKHYEQQSRAKLGIIYPLIGVFVLGILITIIRKK